MIVESLELQNFLMYRERTSLDLKGRKTIGIAGPNESGKSTLLRAICYGTYGVQGQTTEREVKLINDRATSPMVVRLGLRMDDGSLLEIERGRTKTNEAILSATGMAGNVSAIQQQLEEHIELDYRDFVDLSYFVQGDIHGFMSGNKRAYFQRWTRSLEYWRRLEQAAKDLAEEISSKRDVGLATLSSLRAKAESLSLLSRELQAAKSALAGAEALVDSLDERVILLTKEVAAQEAKVAVTVQVNSLRDNLDDINEQIEDHDIAIGRLKSEVRKIGKGLCPVLGSSCKPLKDSGKQKRTELNADLRSGKTKGVALYERRKELENAIDKALRKPEPKSSAGALRSATGDLGRAKSKLRRAQEVVAGVAARFEDAKAAKKSIRGERRVIAQTERKLGRAKFLQFMCGKSGVPSALIESELKKVEDRCNWILERLEYAKRIKFSAFRELAGYEKICPRCGGEAWKGAVCSGCGTDRPHKRKDEPTVTILDGLVERPFDLESGGAKVLQSFAARMAGGLFVSSMTGVPLHLIMLDEVFAMLDTANQQRLMSLVLDKLITEFGLRQQIVVSHSDDVINAVEDLLVVRRQKGQAVVRWA
ncbi:MAG: AAA family ATPase [Deltaproteobacteria bacterium]|nr:AAA family ATPase [Deltaproteobacteria bacterium]